MLLFNRFEQFKKIEKDVWVHHNFFTEKEQSFYKDLLNGFSEEQWQKHGNYEDQDHDDEFWMDKLSLDVIGPEIGSRLINLVAPVHWTFQHTNFVRLRTGQSGYLHYHNDVEQEFESSGYIGDWTGGEIIFPNLNFKYLPLPGDLIIFKADPEHEHYVSEVTSGVRYSYCDFLYKHPGYFVG